MGQLREVQLALERKKRAAASKANGDDEVKALGTLNSLVDGLKQPTVKPERFEDVSRQLAKGITGLGKAISEIPATDLSPVLKAIDGLAKTMNQLIGALNAIEIPTPEAPVVNVDAPDLSDLQNSLDALRQDISNIQIRIEAPEKEEKEDKPKTVIFDVERNRGGYLKRVIAREQ